VSFLQIEALVLILFVGLGIVAGKALMRAERNGVGVRGILRRGVRDGFLTLSDAPRHGGDRDDPMHLRDELPPLPFHPPDGRDADRPPGRRFPSETGV
jgi:hypothetical protein